MATGDKLVTLDGLKEVYDKVDGDVEGLKSAITNGYIGANKAYPQAIKGVTGVMQYRAGVLQGKKLAIQSGVHVLIDDPTDDVFLFETGLGWIAGDTLGLYFLNKSNLSYVSQINPNVATRLSAVASDRYLAVNKSEFHYLDNDFVHDGIPENTVRSVENIVPTEFSTYSYSGGVTVYGGSIKVFTPFRYTGTVTVTGADAIMVLNLDGTHNSHTTTTTVTVEDKIIAIAASDPENVTISFKSDSKTTTELQEEIEDLQAGFLDANSIDMTRLEGVTGVMQYFYGRLKGKTIQDSSGNIVGSETDEVWLFETGKGWIVNDSCRTIILNKSTLTKSSNGSNANIALNLAGLASDKLYATNKTGMHVLDFDFVNDGKFPYTNKDLTKLPKTNFSTYRWSSGIVQYGGSIKAFAPFYLDGSVKVTNCNGASWYNLDGTIGGGLSVVNNTVSAENKIVVIFSSDIDNATVEFSEAEYEFSDEKCSVFGDSLTADAPYYPYLANMTGMQIKNCGIGGTSVSGSGATCFWQDVRINALEGKFIIIMGGTNDKNATIGTLSMDNCDTGTFVGAYNTMLSKIYYRYKISSGYYQDVDYTGVEQLETATFPNIILVTPPKDFGNGTTSEQKVKAIGDAVKQIAEWWGLPLVDAYSNMQLNVVSIDYFFADPSQDGTHYNAHGRSKLAALIAAKMNECYANFDSQE